MAPLAQSGSEAWALGPDPKPDAERQADKSDEQPQRNVPRKVAEAELMFPRRRIDPQAAPLQKLRRLTIHPGPPPVPRVFLDDQLAARTIRAVDGNVTGPARGPARDPLPPPLERRVVPRLVKILVDAFPAPLVDGGLGNRATR